MKKEEGVAVWGVHMLGGLVGRKSVGGPFSGKFSLVREDCGVFSVVEVVLKL